MPRHCCDQLFDIRRPHWLTVSDMQRNLVSFEKLPLGADPRESLRQALVRQAVEGWHAESDGAYGFVFIAMGSERRLVNLTPVDPSDCLGAGHAFLAGRGAVQ